MCLKMQFADGTVGIICGTRQKVRYCSCGRASDFLCDWKMKEKKPGTCDRPVCKSHAQQVGPDKHLCQEHRKAYADWLKRHPEGFSTKPADPAQLSLL
jgi:hypothetical protein